MSAPIRLLAAPALAAAALLFVLVTPLLAASGATTTSAEEQDAAYSRSLAESRYLDGDLESAVRLYLQAGRLSVDPAERAGSLVNAAWLEFLLGNREQSVAILQGALRAEPDLELEERLYTEGFVRAFLRARVLILQQGLEPSLSPAPSRTRAPHPDQPRAIYARAVERQKDGDAEAALPLFQRVAALTLGAEGEAQELRRKSLMHLGFLYYERGQWDDAATAYDEAIGLDRTDTAAWKNLGLARLSAREFPGAVAAFREAYARDPGDLSIALNLAQSLIQAESWEDAVSWISDAVRHHDNDAELRLQLGRAHAGRGSRQQAARAWHSAMDLDASTDWRHGRRAALELSVALFEDANHAESATVARIALEHEPSDAAFWNLLGLAQQEGGEIESAAASFQRACGFESNRAEYRNNLGRALAAAGDLDRAEEAFVLALALEPGFETAQANLDQVRARLRQR